MTETFDDITKIYPASMHEAYVIKRIKTELTFLEEVT
jgi:hypothetical protein